MVWRVKAPASKPDGLRESLEATCWFGGNRLPGRAAPFLGSGGIRRLQRVVGLTGARM